MKRCTSRILVPVVLCAMGSLAFIFSGCEKAEEPPRESPESYMKDTNFISTLVARKDQQRELVQARNEIAKQMKAKIVAMRAQLKTDDNEKVKAELEKDPEWNRLYAECTNANAKVEAVRRGTFGIVRERITPKKNDKISK